MRRIVAVACSLLLAAACLADVTLHYEFKEDIGGQVEDLSGRGHLPEVQVQGTGENAWIHTPGGTGVRVIAEGDVIKAPFDAFNGPRGTMRMTVWLKDLEGNQTLWRIYSASGDGMSLVLREDGRVMLAYYRRALGKWYRLYFSARLLEAERWHQVEASWDFEGHLSLALDGEVQSTLPLPPEPRWAEDSGMYFGNNHAGNAPLRGAIGSIILDDEPSQAAGQRVVEMEPGEPMTWDADGLSIDFDRRYGSVLQGTVAGKRIFDADEPIPLWSIELREDLGRGGQPVVVTCADAPRPRMSAEGDTWRMHWEDVPLPDDSTVDVRAVVRPGPEDGLTNWRIEVDNTSETLGIWTVEFPQVTVAPLSERVAEHEMLLAHRSGAAHPDPFRAASDNPAPRTFRSNTPGAHMQFMALASPDAGNTYFATYDPAYNAKEQWLIAYPDRQRGDYRLKQSPTDLGVPGEDYAQDWPAVIGHVAGDWYDVCRIYRRWAIEQPWCAKGPVAAREDIPDWYKRSTLALRQMNWSDDPVSDPNVTNSVAFAQVAAGPNMSIWYNWHEVDRSSSGSERAGDKGLSAGAGWPWEVPPGVPEAVEVLKNAGVYPTAYVNTRVFDPGDSPDHPQRQWVLPFVVRDVYGEPDYYSRERNLWDACSFTEGWRDRYLSNCLKAMRAGFKGIYLDSYGRGKRPCFETAHGHSRGGGSQVTDAQRLLAQGVRGAIREIDPEAIMTAEANVEAHIDVLDGKLFHYSYPPDYAPLWNAVYHDYQLCYGRTLPVGDVDTGRLRPITGHLLADGIQIGRIFTSAEERAVLEPENAEFLDYLKRCAEARRRAHQYLALGEFMRPPAPETEVATISVNHRGKDVTMPAVKLRAWRAPDGSVAHVLVNLTDEEQTLSYRYDTADYGFTVDMHTLAHIVVAADDLNIAENGACRRTVTLPAWDINIVRLVDGG